MKKKEMILVAAALFAMSMTSRAAEPVKTYIGADIVSNYVWRGSKLDGVAIQPTLGLEWGGFSANVWGSTGLISQVIDARELDLTLSYTIGSFTFGLTDYFCADSDTKYFDFKKGTPHVVEANIGYDLGFMAINWYTNALGAVGFNDKGDKVYASYLEVSAPFSFAGLEWEAALGATPWGNDYYGAESFAVINCSLKACKDLSIGSATLPVFAQLMANPSTEGIFFVCGISF